MLLLIIVGFILTKRKMLSRATISQLTEILLWIVTPAVIVKSFLNVQFSTEYIFNMLLAALLALLSHLAGFAAGFIFIKVRPHSRQTVYRFGSMISNAGFMALPLAEALFSSEGVLFVSIYVIMVNIFIWTLGRSMFKTDEKTPIKKMIFNPGIIGIIIGIAAAALKCIFWPQMLTEAISYVAALNTPLAMLITGFYLVGASARSCINDGCAWLMIFIRQIALPVIMMLLFKFVFGIDELLMLSMVLSISAPCAVMVIMFSAKYNGDEYIASQTVSLSTITSIITMPLIMTIAFIISL